MDEIFLQELKVPFTTPDLAILECQQQHLLFDCRVKKGADVLCSAYTVEKMSLFIRNEDNLPLPLRLRGIHRARVGGALYKTTTEGIVELDKIHQNRLLFERKWIQVFVPYVDTKQHRDISILPTKVWFYSAIPDLWEEQIDMSRTKYNLSPESPAISLARTYTDNEPILNNHFRYFPKKIEDYYNKRKPVLATQEVVDYVSRKNEETINNLKKTTWKQRIHLK